MVNYLAVLGATVAAFAVGMLWYTVLFGKMWRKEMGVVESGSMDGMAKSMIGGFVATLVMVYVLGDILLALGMHDMANACVVAFWLWLGFVATILSNSMWYEHRSLKLYLINASHYLVAITVAALVLVSWPW
jgi:hypothetical protein